MSKFKNKLAGFFYGRYGNDTLNKTLTAIYLVWLIAFTIIDIFVQSIAFSIIGWIVTLTLFILIISRTMSRKIYARRKENEKFCNFFKLRKNKFRDRKTHVYKKCPACKNNLRLPKQKGKHTVVCPCCRNRFDVRI